MVGGRRGRRERVGQGGGRRRAVSATSAPVAVVGARRTLALRSHQPREGTPRRLLPPASFLPLRPAGRLTLLLLLTCREKHVRRRRCSIAGEDLDILDTEGKIKIVNVRV